MHVATRLSVFAAVLALTVTPVQGASAQVFNTSFGGAGYSCFNGANAPSCSQAFGGRSLSYIWNEGDFWRQSISGSGLASVTGLSLNLNLRNVLAAPNEMTFAVFVNGAEVGQTTTYTAINNDSFFSQFDFTFLAIAAATYDVELRVLAPSVPGGGGSIGLYTDGESAIQLQSSVVPEPASMALVAAGLAVLGAVARRRRLQ